MDEHPHSALARSLQQQLAEAREEIKGLLARLDALVPAAEDKPAPKPRSHKRTVTR